MAVMVSGTAFMNVSLDFGALSGKGRFNLAIFGPGGIQKRVERIMALFDDVPVEKPSPHRIGEDLGRLSIDELNERIVLMEVEIARLREAIAAKTASRAAASSFFKT
ncbi:DUF1192 domain-containing protein [Kaistia defluvii]|uniref:DUF1192 domain-containing protein n=1 Tax=Kaistia defluvii TaxID=410841 RepID=UPI0038995F2A